MKSIYDISLKTLTGENLNLKEFEGKKILIVNVASECGYTPQYSQLQELATHFGDKLVVIGVPCNDFGGQEPGSPEEIISFCSVTFGVSFYLTEKVFITKDTCELYEWLTKKANNQVEDYEVEWNFHKFLINEQGKLIGSYPSSVTPLDNEIVDKI